MLTREESFDAADLNILKIMKQLESFGSNLGGVNVNTFEPELVSTEP